MNSTINVLPEMGFEANFDAPRNFPYACSQIARRLRYLTWAYDEIVSRAAGVLENDLVELSVVMMEIVAADMRSVYETADAADAEIARLEKDADLLRMKSHVAAEAPPVAGRRLSVDDLLKAGRAARDAEVPFFESAEEVKRAFDLLRAEKTREAGGIPLDRDGRPIP